MNPNEASCKMNDCKTVSGLLLSPWTPVLCQEMKDLSRETKELDKLKVCQSRKILKLRQLCNWRTRKIAESIINY